MNTLAASPTQAEQQDLVRDVLSEGAEVRIRVTGASMNPAIQSGDVVFIKGVPPSSLKCGDVVLFEGKQGSVMHRVVRIRQSSDNSVSLRTKGDALKSVDAAADGSRVVGKVVRVERGDDVFDLETVRGEWSGRLIAWRGLVGAGIRKVLRSFSR